MKDLAKEFSIPGNVKCKKIYDDIWEIEKKSQRSRYRINNVDNC
jgi:hypothetical protein